MTRLGAILAVLVALLAVACGGGGDAATDGTSARETTATGGAGGRSQTLRLEAAASGALRFDVDVLEATAQTVRLVMTNPSSVPHNIAVKGDDVDEKGPVVTGGSESTLTLRNLQPGEYTFYCSVPGHEERMKGTLVVRVRA